jgi:hypothetical protein
MDQAILQSNATPNPTEQPTTQVALFGRCMLPNQLEVPCQAVAMSPDQAMLVSAHCPKIGDRTIVYLDHLGRIEGNTAGHFPGGFTVEIECTTRKRDKLAEQIGQLKNHEQFGENIQRDHQRIEPKEANSELRLSDGRSYPIKIIDISLSDADVKIDVKPAIGSKVWLAGMQGTVTRHFSEGIGMQFASVTDPKTIGDHFA